MESAVGKVAALHAHIATIDVDGPVACQRCASGRGCGAGFLSGADRKVEIQVVIPPHMSVREGDVIELRIAPKYLLRAALLAYGVPLGCMLLTLWLTWLLVGNPGDVAGILLALAGLGAGFVVSRFLALQESVCRRFVPSVGRVSGA